MTDTAYLEGLLAPVPDEIDAVDLPIRGTLPPELTGRYFRNGPNPLPGQDPGHWFAGAGMVHGVRLRNGRAEWYRNRWVRTASLAGKPFVSERGLDRTAVPANTSVVRHADKILALVESGFPYELTPELDTVGPVDFGGRLTTAFTAHPKLDPATGDLHVFGYGALPPYLTYHRLTAAGDLLDTRVIDVPGPTMMHDFAITEHHAVWLDLPVVFDMSLVGRGMPYQWSDGYGARLGVMPLGGGPVRWIEIDPCYVFHVGNAHEDAAGHVVLDAVRYTPGSFLAQWSGIGGTTAGTEAAHAGGGSPSEASRAAGGVVASDAAAGASLHRWTIDPAAGTVSEQQLDDRSVEFPTINDELVGRPSRYRYTVGGGEIVKYDTVSGAASAIEVAGRPGEAEFVRAADGASEDEGWLLSIVSTLNGSELRCLDAHDLTEVGAVLLPRRVPAGFHGCWLPD
ncbi:carotenoid oxygenase family protein [Actinocatenispora sera]|uniref:Dioxygenase n=1 Tax=Actinocatenispora sera TaxID=390989 RepID=A0A810KXY4_9ACTN|nr:carotenoid oxygenase family protein [Actinocatenispora sera]BCJ27292.1 carotenoid cleavage dioxygenase [Actinocatenispora sera]